MFKMSKRVTCLLLLLRAAAPTSSHDPSFLRPSHAQRWEVTFGAPAAPPSPARGEPPSAPLASYTMTDGAGALWRCAVPLGGGGGGGGGGVAPSQGAPLERALAALDALRAQEACALRVEGYWTFRVCAGGRVTQFHADEPSGPAGRALDLGSPVPARDRVEALPGGARALLQRFEGGDDGRAADVQWVCLGGAAAAAAAAGAPSTSPTLELLSVAEAPERAYTLRVGVRSAALCAALPSPAALLAPINGTCIEHSPGGWWSYSVCLGREVTQFHVEGGARAQETVLGRYDWAAGEALAGEGWAGQPAAAGGGGGDGGAPLAANLQTNLGAAAILQSYAGGSPCPVRGGTPRSASVRFECVPPGAGGALGEEAVGAFSLTFLHMREAPTCVYTFVFGSPLPCEVAAPAAAHMPPPRVTGIDCQRA